MASQPLELPPIENDYQSRIEEMEAAERAASQRKLMGRILRAAGIQREYPSKQPVADELALQDRRDEQYLDLALEAYARPEANARNARSATERWKAYWKRGQNSTTDGEGVQFLRRAEVPDPNDSTRRWTSSRDLLQALSNAAGHGDQEAGRAYSVLLASMRNMRTGHTPNASARAAELLKAANIAPNEIHQLLRYGMDFTRATASDHQSKQATRQAYEQNRLDREQKAETERKRKTEREEEAHRSELATHEEAKKQEAERTRIVTEHEERRTELAKATADAAKQTAEQEAQRTLHAKRAADAYEELVRMARENQAAAQAANAAEANNSEDSEANVVDADAVRHDNPNEEDTNK